jgi:hypothetical protein
MSVAAVWETSPRVHVLDGCIGPTTGLLKRLIV